LDGLVLKWGGVLMLGRHVRKRQPYIVVEHSCSVIVCRHDAVGGGCTKTEIVTTCSTLGAQGKVSTGDAAPGPDSLFPATSGLSGSAGPRKGSVIQETFSC